MSVLKKNEAGQSFRVTNAVLGELSSAPSGSTPTSLPCCVLGRMASEECIPGLPCPLAPRWVWLLEVSAGDGRAGRGRGMYSGSLLWAEVGGGCILLLKAAAPGMAPSRSYAPLCVLIPHSPS